MKFFGFLLFPGTHLKRLYYNRLVLQNKLVRLFYMFMCQSNCNWTLFLCQVQIHSIVREKHFAGCLIMIREIWYLKFVHQVGAQYHCSLKIDTVNNSLLGCNHRAVHPSGFWGIVQEVNPLVKWISANSFVPSVLKHALCGPMKLHVQVLENFQVTIPLDLIIP